MWRNIIKAEFYETITTFGGGGGGEEDFSEELKRTHRCLSRRDALNDTICSERSRNLAIVPIIHRRVVTRGNSELGAGTRTARRKRRDLIFFRIELQSVPPPALRPRAVQKRVALWQYARRLEIKHRSNVREARSIRRCEIWYARSCYVVAWMYSGVLRERNWDESIGGSVRSAIISCAREQLANQCKSQRNVLLMSFLITSAAIKCLYRVCDKSERLDEQWMK